jgi:hypothetical protein
MPTLLGEKREGSGKLRSRAGTPVFEESYHYLVQADSKFQAREEILTTAGLPQLNITTSAGGFAVCRSLSATKRTVNPLYWDVTAEFSSEVDETSGGSTDPAVNPPEAWVPIYETKFERHQRLVAKDASGDPFVNSAGEAFQEKLTITRHVPIWEFFQFEPATVSDETIIGRCEVVNNATFKGRAAKTLLCVVLSSVIGRFYGQLRRLTQYQLKYNSDDWTQKMLDVGTRHLDQAGTATVPYNAKILDTGGYTADNLEVILGPLDGAGEPAGGFDGATDFAVMDGTEPAILEFDIYPQVDFATFLRI